MTVDRNEMDIETRSRRLFDESAPTATITAAWLGAFGAWKVASIRPLVTT